MFFSFPEVQPTRIQTTGHGTLSGCENKDGDYYCQYWVKKGRCQSHKEAMLVSCRKACQFCTHSGTLNFSQVCPMGSNNRYLAKDRKRLVGFSYC